MPASTTASASRVTFRDPDLDSFEVVDPSAEGRYWQSWTRAWTSRPVGHPVDGYMLCAFLADPATAAAMRTARDGDQLMREVMERTAAAPTVSIVVHPRTWQRIKAAQRAARSPAMREAVHRAPVGQRVVERFKAVLRSLAGLVRPMSGCAAHRVDLARASAAKTASARPFESNLLIEDKPAFQRDLRESAKEIRRPGNWYGLGGEIAVTAITRLGRWPQGRPLHIEDTKGLLLARMGDEAWTGEPVRVSLDVRRDHYSPIVDGRIGDVPADGDCFFASVLTAMTPTERRRLLLAQSDSGLTSKGAQSRLRQFVADTVERMARHPDTAPEAVKNAWIAHRA